MTLFQYDDEHINISKETLFGIESQMPLSLSDIIQRIWIPTEEYFVEFIDDFVEVIYDFEDDIEDFLEVIGETSLVSDKIKLFEDQCMIAQDLWKILQSMDLCLLRKFSGDISLKQQDMTLPGDCEDMAMSWSNVLCCFLEDMIRFPGWKIRDAFELDICGVVKKLKENSLDQFLGEFHESDVELGEQDSMTTNDVNYETTRFMEINVPEMKHGFSISDLPHSANLMSNIRFFEQSNIFNLQEQSNIFDLQGTYDHQTFVCIKHCRSRESGKNFKGAEGLLHLQFGSIDEVKQDFTDMHHIRTNKSINAIKKVNIHLKNAIHIGMPTLCSGGEDEYDEDIEIHGADKRSESRNPKVSFSVESEETCAEPCFLKWNPIHDSHSKQNSFEVLHRRHELQLRDFDCNINTNEDGAFLKNEIPYQIESLVFERNVVPDLIPDIFGTGYDELDNNLYQFEDNTVITRNYWNGRCYDTVHPTECLNTNGLKEECLPRTRDCLSNTTSWLKLTFSTLRTRILNFCQSTSRLSTSYQLRWKSCFSYIWLFQLLMSVSTAEPILNVQHLTVIVGPSLRLHCSVNYPDPVIWRHEHVGTGDPNYVYHHRFGLRGQYKSGGRHSIANGTNDLVITNVTDSDAGKYSCEDKEHIDIYDIVILKSAPSCRSNIDLANVIGENDCGMDPDLLRLHCSVVYSGNFPPRLRWLNSRGEHAMIGTNVSTPIRDETNYCTESTLTVTANMQLNDTYFICQVADSPSVGAVSKCRTEKITVHSLQNSSVALEINTKSEQEVSCTADTIQPCNYQWTHQYQKYKIAISGSTLNFRDVSFGEGIYECQAECLLRGQICRTMPLRISVVAGGMDNSEKTVGYSALQNIAVGVFLVLPFLVMLILTIVIQRRHVAKTRNEKDHPYKDRDSILEKMLSSKLDEYVEDNISVQVYDSDNVSLEDDHRWVDLRPPIL